MSSIADVAAQISPQVTTASKDKSTLGKNDFLNLLVAQMKFQDPLNPQDPTQYMSQLTQYSSLEQLMNVNTNLQDLGSNQSLNAMASAAAYIGKTATVNGDTFATSIPGAATSLHYNLPRNSASTTITITDAAGGTVRSIPVGAQNAGDLTYGWDGKRGDGSSAPAGAYKFSIDAVDANGDPVTASTQVRGVINGVKFDNGQAMLDIGGGNYSLSDVVGISN